MTRRAALLSFVAALPLAAQGGWKAGVAKAEITPGEPIWMAGFASRTKPSEGVRQEIHVRSLALQDESGKPVALATLDLVMIDRRTADEVAAQCLRRYGLTRDRLVLNVSHTHSGPVAGLTVMPLYDLTPEQRAAIGRYTGELIRKTVDTIGASLQNLQPATVWFEQGLAGIAVNRRRVGRRSLPGPVDHDVPILAVRDGAGTLRAAVVGYACHATALNDYLISNDWPGYAVEAIEKAHPGATALFVQGCGADSNPLPRAGEDLARKRGEILAAAFEQVFAGKMRPVAGPLKSAFTLVDLPMVDIWTREALQERLKDKLAMYRTTARHLLQVLDREGKLPDRYPYPIQVWQFGSSLKFIALGGEVVVDYGLRLKTQHGFEDTWVAGYSNDVPAYIPSRRVLEEGGYEGRDAMVLFGRSGRFSPAVEDIILKEAAELVRRTAP
ncbi:MAG: neutral/alkaline non-lysosomal ceramidase N-terminal domain-containing protein [Bryobacterales bacterium]|nr:neutral/alkaline non-lysosomal ceramidase N-terminal domain-containing protein [Bryobacterales bacterium]